MMRKKLLGILIGCAIISVLLTGCGNEGGVSTSEASTKTTSEEEQAPNNDVSNDKDVNATKNESEGKVNTVKKEEKNSNSNSNTNKKDVKKQNNIETNNEKKSVTKETTSDNKKIIEESKKASNDNKEKVKSVKEKIEENKSNNKEVTNEKKDYIYDIIGCLDGADNCYVAAQEIYENSCKNNVPLTVEQKKKIEYYMNNINQQWTELANKSAPKDEKYAKLKSDIIRAQKELSGAVKVYNQGIESSEKVSKNQDVAKGAVMIENAFNGVLSQIGEEINNLPEYN